MRDFEDSTLWRISAFERMRQQTGSSGFQRLDGPSVLSSTLLADLQRDDRDTAQLDALELVAACMRHREPALIYLQHAGLVWPVTLFPDRMLYHSSRDVTQATDAALADLRQIGVEPPGVRPPGHLKSDRVGHAHHYHELAPLLWAMAMRGPRGQLLREIGGTAAYRLLPGNLPDGLVAGGANGSALDRLRAASAPLREIATWPGMSLERASRLLNALYLFSALLVTRGTRAAREQPNGEVRSRGLLDFFRPRR